MLIEAALGNESAGEEGKDHGACETERQEGRLQRPRCRSRHGQEDQQSQNAGGAAPAEGSVLTVQAPVELFDQAPDPGDGMPGPRVKAVGIAERRLGREGEA